mmetsp:Transcript_7136/g.18461  ORF Transcript_7136/g.18461 Transcript_7136/m.18461 type:complete len:116 (+) Transcript_7136:17-364(+)
MWAFTRSTASMALDSFSGKCVLLMSGQSSNQLTIVAQRKIETQLEGLGIEYTKVDGMEPDNKEARAALWAKADAKPGTYPIVFNMQSGKYWYGDDLQVALDDSALGSALAEFKKL